MSVNIFRSIVLVIIVLILSCDEYFLEQIEGCTVESACNYNAEATVDDDSCRTNDCGGICGGSAEVDECDVCAGPGIADGECDCDGNGIDEGACINNMAISNIPYVYLIDRIYLIYIICPIYLIYLINLMCLLYLIYIIYPIYS